MLGKKYKPQTINNLNVSILESNISLCECMVPLSLVFLTLLNFNFFSSMTTRCTPECIQIKKSSECGALNRRMSAQDTSMRVLDIPTNAGTAAWSGELPILGGCEHTRPPDPSHPHAIFKHGMCIPRAAGSGPARARRLRIPSRQERGPAPRAQGPGKRYHMIDSRPTNRSSGSGSGQPIVTLIALKPAPAPALCLRAGTMFAAAILCVASPPFP